MSSYGVYNSLKINILAHPKGYATDFIHKLYMTYAFCS